MLTPKDFTACNMSGIKIALVKLKHRSIFLKAYENIYSSRKEVEMFYKRFLENEWISGAWKNSELVGVLTWMPRETAKNELAEIVDLWVKAEERRKGIGGRLIDHALAQMRQYYQYFGFTVRRVMLFTGASEKYLAARNLYEKKGFKIVATIPPNTLNNSPNAEFLYVLQLPA